MEKGSRDSDSRGRTEERAAPPPVAPKPSFKVPAKAKTGESAMNANTTGNVNAEAPNANVSDTRTETMTIPKPRPKPAVKPRRPQPATTGSAKLREVLSELIKTEETYVVKLSLLVACKEDLQRRVNTDGAASIGVEPRMIEQVIPGAIQSIRMYHANMLLPTFEQVYKAMIGDSYQSTMTELDRLVMQLASGNRDSSKPTQGDESSGSTSMCISSIGEDCTKLSQVFKAKTLHKVIITFYKQFVPEFERVNQLTNEFMQNRLFAAAVNDFLKPFKQAPSLAGLSLAHHLLDLVQRLPRYPLVLKEYCKCFRPAECKDEAGVNAVSHMNQLFNETEFKEAHEALEMMTESVSKVNASIGEMVNQARLLQLIDAFESLGEDLIKPGRSFVCENHAVMKIAARSFEAQSRSLFLFNDILMICKHDSVHADSYRVRTKLSVASADGNSRMCVVTTPFPVANESKWSAKMVLQLEAGRVIADLCLRVQAREKDVVMQFADEGTKGKWIEYLRKVGARVVESGDELDHPMDLKERGIRAPTWQDDSDATRCALTDCRSPTFTLFNRRHHCRACGKLVCGSCSGKSIRLAYSNKVERVCSECYEIIEQRLIDQATGRRGSEHQQLHSDSTTPSVSPAITVAASNVENDDDCTQTPDRVSSIRRTSTSKTHKEKEPFIADYLEVREKSGSYFNDHNYQPNVRFTKFTRAYLVMPRDDIHLLLYVAKNDPFPVRRFPLPGWTIQKNTVASGKAKVSVKLLLPSVSPKLPPKGEIEILLPDETTLNRWTEALECALRGSPVGTNTTSASHGARKLSESASACSNESGASRNCEQHADSVSLSLSNQKSGDSLSPSKSVSSKCVNHEHDEPAAASTIKRHCSANTLFAHTNQRDAEAEPQTQRHANGHHETNANTLPTACLSPENCVLPAANAPSLPKMPPPKPKPALIPNLAALPGTGTRSNGEDGAAADSVQKKIGRLNESLRLVSPQSVAKLSPVSSAPQVRPQINQ